MEWSLSAIQDILCEVAPTREMLVCGGVRRTHEEVAARSRGLAAFLVDNGVGAHRERDALARWECGQAPVALILHNCTEYIEAMLGCFRARAVPFNVNHHYKPVEIRNLLDGIAAEAVIYHRSLGRLVAEALEDRDLVLIDVDDDPDASALSGSTGFEGAVTTVRPDAGMPAPSPDDVYLACTGGTTGVPKGVLWRQADIFVAAMGGSEDSTAASIADVARDGIGTWFAAPPLMHVAAQWTVFGGLHSGATILLHDDRDSFDANKIIEEAARERAALIAIVGDAYARPMIEAIRRNPVDLSALQRIGTGGAVTSDESKQALIELLPRVTIVDGYGASETGGMAFGETTRTGAAKAFSPAPGAAVLSADRTHFLEPGSAEIGWTARRGRVPLGYLGDRQKTEVTFPVVDGERLAVPGDRATLGADGTIRVLGRDSLVINTGGEKVFVEEVEEALRRHVDVVDALVVGIPSERFGQEVAAVVQLRPGAATAPSELRDFVSYSLARFKAPRSVVYCDAVGRHPSGKPDYQWALLAAAGAVSATKPSST
jgi:3-oxocholest-4-en-26-oate---CoA ligase